MPSPGVLAQPRACGDRESENKALDVSCLHFLPVGSASLQDVGR
jgi:hypothetical protein